MARRISQADPALEISFFNTGFYTYRSQLFAPFKQVGINVIAYHDPVLDGANFENTDLFEWQRRPGFSKFCSVQLPSTEVINQWDSYRNLNGQVVPVFDSSVRLATFTPTTITTIFSKTTIQQGYIASIGNMVYFADGAAADYAKYDAGFHLSSWGLAAPTIDPTSTGMGFWYPHAFFQLGNAIQDTNGNIEVVTAILIPNGSMGSPDDFTTLALAGGTGAWAGSVAAGGIVSQTLTSAGHTNYLFLYDFNLAIPSAAIIDGVQVTIPKLVMGGTAVDQSVKLVVGGSVVGIDHASAAPWSTTAFVTTVYGGPTDSWGASLTGSQASTQGASGFGVAIAADVTSTTNFNLVQSGTANSTGATTLYAFPNPVTAGNTIVFGLHTFHEALVSVSDNRGNTYTQVVSNVFGEHTHYVYLASNVAAGTTTITVSVTNLQSNSFTCINPHEFHGILTASPVDVTGSNNSGGSTVTSPFNSGTVTTTHADDMIFTYVYVDGAGGIIPAGYTAGTNTTFFAAGGTQQLASAFDAPGAIGSYSPSWSSGSEGATVALKSAESATVEIHGGGPNAPVITVYYHLPAGVGPGFTGPTEPIWPTALGGIVNDGGVQWTNDGPVEIWYPLTNYPVPVVVVDTNGNIQLATTATSPVPFWNSSTAYPANAVVSYGGGYWINVLGNTNTGNTPGGFTTSTTTGGTTTYQNYWAATSNPVVTGTIAPVWNTTIGGTTVDGSYTWTNLGQGSPLASFGYAYVYAYRTVYGHLTTASPFSNNTGAILGPLNGSIQAFSISSNIVTFFGSNNFIPGNIFTVLGLTTGTYLNNQTFTVLTATPSSSFPLTALQVTSDVLTVTALNNLGSAGGQSITFSGVSDATLGPVLNGETFVVLPGATSTAFTVALVHANYGPANSTGTVLVDGSWTAAFNNGSVPVGLTADSGTAAPLISTITGQGTALLDGQGFALCNSIATITAFSVTADIVTVYASNNFQPGLWVTFAGLSVATFLNGQQAQVIAVDQSVGTQNTWFQIYFITPNSVQTPDSGTATFNAIEIYRTSDGGGTYLFGGAVTNPGANIIWTFDDFVTDANLDILLVAALAHQNDPPPGAPGSSIIQTGSVLTYWQGRLWLVVGNYVYFDAGPDCTNGISEEAWPPGNRFQFAGPVLNLVPTADGVGLLVYLADRVNAILGGPETISFYPTDALTNFGIANPNAIYRDGSIIGQFTTQGQFFELVDKQKQDTGEHIADYLTANFTSSKTYVTTHRNGLDIGIFLSNGTDQVLRYGSNIGAWSVPAYPSFGAGALRSIETSVGVYSLMLATPAGGSANYLYARDVNSWGDGGTFGANNGTAYAECNITIGSITLSQPGARLFPLQHVVGYFNAAGTLDNGGPSKPDIWIMPNEISTASGIGFVYLPEIVQEPPIGQNQPSKSLLALRWNVNMLNSTLASQFMHHLQIKIQFEPENAPNTIKALSFCEDQST